MRNLMDDRSKRGPQDPARVNIAEDYEVRYWTATLSVPKERLAAVVAKVGCSTRAVRRELAKEI